MLQGQNLEQLAGFFTLPGFRGDRHPAEEDLKGTQAAQAERVAGVVKALPQAHFGENPADELRVDFIGFSFEQERDEQGGVVRAQDGGAFKQEVVLILLDQRERLLQEEHARTGKALFIGGVGLPEQSR